MASSSPPSGGSGRAIAAPAAVNPAERESRTLVNKAERNNANAKRRIEMARRARAEKFSTWVASTLIDGVRCGQLGDVKFDLRDNGTCRFAASSSAAGGHAQARPPPRSNPVPTPQGRQRHIGRGDLHENKRDSKHDARGGGRAPQEPPLTHRRPAVSAAPLSSRDASIVAQTPCEKAPPGHLGTDSNNISADMVRSVSNVTGVPTPYARAALEDTGGDVDAATDGLIRQQQEESDRHSAQEMQKKLERAAMSVTDPPAADQQFTCAGQQQSKHAQRTGPPGEASMESGASSSSAVGPSGTDDGPAAPADSEATTPHLGAPGNRPATQRGGGRGGQRGGRPTRSGNGG